MPSDLSLIAQQAETLLKKLDLYKAAAGSAEESKAGLTKKPVEVHRQGKVFTQERMVREGQDQPKSKPAGPKPFDFPGPINPKYDKKQDQKESQSRQEQFDKEVQDIIDKQPPEKKKRLNEAGKTLRDAVKNLKEGDRTTIKHLGKEIAVERLHGSMVRVGGMTVGSLRAGALVLHGLEGGAGTAAEVASGTTGAGIRYGAAERALHPVSRAAERVTNKEARKEAEAKQRKLNIVRSVKAEEAKRQKETEKSKKAEAS